GGGGLGGAGANADGWPIRPQAGAALLGPLGIDQETTVVAYDGGGSVMAARLFFVLEYFGHERVRVLNGGLAKWKREGRPLEVASPTIAPRRFEPRPRREAPPTPPPVPASPGTARGGLL